MSQSDGINRQEFSEDNGANWLIRSFNSIDDYCFICRSASEQILW